MLRDVLFKFSALSKLGTRLRIISGLVKTKGWGRVRKIGVAERGRGSKMRYAKNVQFP